MSETPQGRPEGTGRAARAQVRYDMDLRIECTSLGPVGSNAAGTPQERHHTLYVGPGLTRAEYVTLARTTYARNAHFGRYGTDFRVRRCLLVTTTTYTEELN